MLITKVSDIIVAYLLTGEGYPYLFRDDDEPFTFIGDDAAERALYWQDLTYTKIPVKLSVREAFLISKILKDNQLLCDVYGIGDSADKISKAIFDRTK